jgi:hypothetical protein
VVAIDVEVSLGLNVQINQAVACDLIQHVIKETNAGVQVGQARAIQIDLDLNHRLGRLASDLRCSWCAHGDLF